jgi:hypothetical protein
MKGSESAVRFREIQVFGERQMRRERIEAADVVFIATYFDMPQ